MTELIKEIMAQVFQIAAESIVEDTSPDSVERWDSLKHMQLIMALEDEFGIEFPDDVIPELLSFTAIEAKIAALKST
jgi:acyl carrier protein